MFAFIWEQFSAAIMGIFVLVDLYPLISPGILCTIIFAHGLDLLLGNKW